jgi:hypothetical protein
LPKSWRDAYNISPDTFSASWTASGEAFLTYAHNNNNCHLIDYGGLVEGGQSLSRLIRLADLDLPELEPVLALRLNSTPQAERASDNDAAYVRANCADLFDRLRSQSELST